MPIDHTGVTTPPELFEKTLAFYVAALKPLGYAIHMQPMPTVVGMGTSIQAMDWWLGAKEGTVVPKPGEGTHTAFKALGE